MKNKKFKLFTRVIAFRVTEDVYNELEKDISKHGARKSEYFRDTINKFLRYGRSN